MTNVTALLLGLLCIASGIMWIGTRSVMRAQIASGEQWRSSSALQLSSAIYLDAISSIPAFAATLLSGATPVLSWTTYLLWTTWTGWLAAKTMVIHVTGRLQLALALYLAWAVLWFVWRIKG